MTPSTPDEETVAIIRARRTSAPLTGTAARSGVDLDLLPGI